MIASFYTQTFLTPLHDRLSKKAQVVMESQLEDVKLKVRMLFVHGHLFMGTWAAPCLYLLLLSSYLAHT